MQVPVTACIGAMRGIGSGVKWVERGAVCPRARGRFNYRVFAVVDFIVDVGEGGVDAVERVVVAVCLAGRG